jgi:hypothetical protein
VVTIPFAVVISHGFYTIPHPGGNFKGEVLSQGKKMDRAGLPQAPSGGGAHRMGGKGTTGAPTPWGPPKD